jgi:glyoxylase-like metal-dependent hydrolase (beta-lactamase superfamily II)
MVGCVYYEGPDATVLIDPLVPPAGSSEEGRFWKALDGDVERLGLPVAILLGNHDHLRSAREVEARYRGGRGSSVWMHGGALAAERLPGGIEAYPACGLNPEEVLFWIPRHRALVAADALLGAGGGELRVAPASWAAADEEGQARYESAFRRDLRKLLDLPIEIVLVAHGEPALEDGREALRRALEAPAWGE